MRTAADFVSSLLVARDEEEQRREARRRRRVDFIVAGNKERACRSKGELGSVVRRSANTMSVVEQELRNSLGDMGVWWDMISENVLEEKRECEKAVDLQKQLTSMYLSAAMKREVVEQSSVVVNDERRLQELEELCREEERHAKEEAAEQAIDSVLNAVDRCIDFLAEHALTESCRGTLLTEIALDCFIPKTNETPLAESDRANMTFARLFGLHPFHLTGTPFLQLLHCMYEKMNPPPSSVSRFDVCRKPLFLIDGPKLSGKTVVSQQVEEQIALLHLSDRDLVNRALEAYRRERNSLPTLLTEEDSDALPFLMAYEERNAEEEELAYHSDARTVQIVESFVRLSPWAAVGKVIEAALLRGESVNPSVIVQLMQLQMECPPVGCHGLLFDGAVAGTEELRCLHRAISQSVHAFEGELQNWPPLPAVAIETPAVVAEGEEREKKKEEKRESKKEDAMSDLLLVRREVRPDRPVAKGEGKSRQLKKGVDINALPPPVLPEVTRPELTAEETAAIECWEQRERTHLLFVAVVHICCGTREIFNRFAGLRIDKETGEHYHMVFHPPPSERVPHISNLDRTKTSTAQLHRVVLHQQRSWEAMQRWFMCKKGADAIVHEVNGERPLEDIVEDVKCILQDAQKKFDAELRMYDAAMAAKARQKEIAANIAEQEEQREAERRRLMAVYSECGAPIPQELELRPSSAPFYTMPDDIPEVFMRALVAFRVRYEYAYSWSGMALEKLVSVLLEHRSIAMGIFHRFWNQPDEKQGKLDAFVANYNRLPPALLGQVSCKEELHVLVDHLKEELFRTVEATGKEAAAKIELIMKKESFLGPWCVSVCNVGIATVQVEVERFLTTLNLVAMYFSAVVGEPCVFEEMESELVIMRSVAESALEQTKGKEKKTTSTKKSPRLEEVVEKTVEDMFAEATGKLIHSMTNYVEKLVGNIAASAKARESSKASAALADEGKPALVLVKCLPFAESELDKAQERIACIRQLFARLLREGEAYSARMKDDMLAHTREKQLNQAAAVNTVVYAVRNAIEEERPLPDMHLGRETFHMAPAAGRAPTHSAPSPQRPQAVRQPQEPMIHATLSATRLHDMIRVFRVAAPDYALSHAEFFNIVSPTDYAGAATKHGQLKTLQEVFDAFDPHSCGFIDWREFVVHLLLWCAPVPEIASSTTKVEEDTASGVENYYIAECSVTHLLETRADLGMEMVTEEVFYDVPFFFDKCLRDDRLEAYVRALWMTFAADDGHLDPLPLLALLCVDRQPVRGAQKAFYVLSRSQEGSLTPVEMDKAFHVRVTNPRNMCLPDVFSQENIAALYDGAPLLSFKSVCERVMGRNMLNNTEAFRRKSFITDALHVE
ncbi:cpc1/kpl2 [Trypanosoma grayi]|uniref:cpc1/kpl2 n=1 Tax=Trypanosoma grayi TaxID=71804 RepID=UPI0004F4749E|nr:cpc1/kpl2 [Trypanosoma grayi]KEG14280.1 cpc1/kpl2 [Trypanosoma grayi]